MPKNNHINLKGFKVLILEDDDINSTFLRALLETEGMDVTVTETGEDGLEELKKNNFDLALIDINLGSSTYNGIDVVREYKAYNPDSKTVTVALTAYTTVGMVEKFMESGFDAYHFKPFLLEDLLKLLDDMKGI